MTSVTCLERLPGFGQSSCEPDFGQGNHFSHGNRGSRNELRRVMAQRDEWPNFLGTILSTVSKDI